MTAPVTTAAALYALDAAYRASTARTAIAVARVMQLWWTSLDPRDIVGTSGRWLDTSVATILAGQDRTVGLADAYTEQVRRLSIPGAEAWTPPEPRAPNIERVRKSLIHTGIRETVVALDRLEASLAEPQEDQRESADRTREGGQRRIMEEGLARAAGTAARLVTDAGQERIYDDVNSDKLALGWARTTKPGCCYFCAMLASRGYVYKEDSFDESDARFIGPGTHKIHDSCGCGLRPLYDRSAPLPERNAELEQLWIDTAKGTGGDQVNNFRKAYAVSALAQPATSS